MLAENLTLSLLETLDRPDLRSIAGPLSITLAASLGAPYRIDPPHVVLGRPALDHPALAATLLRQAIEHARLRLDAPDLPDALVCLAAARLAALFHALDPCPASPPPSLAWITSLAAASPPDAHALSRLWPTLAPLTSDSILTQADFSTLAETLARLWGHLGPTERLMAAGGDERLTVDPVTGLNRYGCSHRPRPWAVTFASSTASSLSERGFDGAETARRQMAIALLRGQDVRTAHGTAARQARQALARFYSLETFEQVILAASGTDCELAVLAIATAHARGRPVTNILIAPDETGTGVPLAAQGLHFAGETARGVHVSRGAPVSGFPNGTTLHNIALRDPQGAPRAAQAIDDECAQAVENAIANGQHVLLHQLDLSKTGLLAPGSQLVESLRARFPGRIDVVVDACQGRLIPARVAGLVRAGVMVMLTGSKFFTGPPFCGTALIPAADARLMGRHRVPAGLADYGHADEWPTNPASPLPEGANFGLALRWHAALAEMTAFATLSPARIRAILTRFMDHARQAITARPYLALLDVPALQRPPLEAGGDWDTLPTILSFLVVPAADAPLALEDARRLHRWLNADLSPWIPGDPCAGRLCHLGQPVPIPASDGTGAQHHIGALRLCAGARLVSGEPSHAGLDPAARLHRECADAIVTLDKIALILRHWDTLLRADPVPHYAPKAFRTPPAR